MGSVNVTTATAAVMSIANPNADRVRVIVTIPALMTQDTTTGDTHGTSVTYHFELTTNGVPSQLGSSTITGKTKSTYQRSHVFTLPKPLSTNVWVLKMVRDTPDNLLSSLANQTRCDSYVEIVDVKVNYANSAIISVGLDPQVFSNIPSRSYLVDGLFIQVPSNYNVLTRVYTGGKRWLGWFWNAAALYTKYTDSNSGRGL